MQNRFTQILAALLCAASLTSLAGCEDNAAPPSMDTESDTSAPATTAPEPELSLPLVQDGKTSFTLIRAEEADEKTVELLQQALKRFEDKTGVRIKAGTDWVKRGEEPDSSTYEILIGQTNRPETAEALTELRYHDYAVSAVGNKIVLCGLTADGTQKAVNYFMNQILSKAEAGSDFFFTADDSFIGRGSYPLDSLMLGEQPVSAYTITLPADASYAAGDFARRLQTLIAGQTGYLLPIAETAEAGAAEIAVTEADGGAWSASLSGEKLTCSAGSLWGWDTLYDAMYELLKWDKNRGNSLTLTAEQLTLSGDIAASDDVNIQRACKVDGELRIMFNNIWGNSGQNAIENRDDMEAELFLAYLPDVLGMQEVSPTSRSQKQNIFHLLSDVYTQVPAVATNSNGNNSTPLVYRADRLELGDYGYHLFNDGAGDYSKSITWAVFTQKENGKKFAVLSTHFYWTGDDKGKAARLIDAREITELAEEIKAKYNVPVIAGGDFNCNISSEPIRNMTAAGWQNTHSLATVYRSNTNGHHSYATYDAASGLYTGGPMPTSTYDRAIDHIFAMGDISVQVFDTVTHRYALDSTDHCPIYVDINLK